MSARAEEAASACTRCVRHRATVRMSPAPFLVVSGSRSHAWVSFFGNTAANARAIAAAVVCRSPPPIPSISTIVARPALARRIAALSAAVAGADSMPAGVVPTRIVAPVQGQGGQHGAEVLLDRRRIGAALASSSRVMVTTSGCKATASGNWSALGPRRCPNAGRRGSRRCCHATAPFRNSRCGHASATVARLPTLSSPPSAT